MYLVGQMLKEHKTSDFVYAILRVCLSKILAEICQKKKNPLSCQMVAQRLQSAVKMRSGLIKVDKCFSLAQNHLFWGKQNWFHWQNLEIRVILLNLFSSSWKYLALLQGVMSSQESLMIHFPSLCSKYKMCLTAASCLHIQGAARLIFLWFYSDWVTDVTSPFLEWACLSILCFNITRKRGFPNFEPCMCLTGGCRPQIILKSWLKSDICKNPY